MHLNPGARIPLVKLMFYSTFEVLDLPGSGPIGTHSVVKLY